ncbi:hypothetical protein LDP52_05175 [Photobacterium damselae]|uniref:hypothetical protein n=1 Tax=Photobacterium damselae TaxID=38293 RepID=UPI0023406C15|nr:hypothetical protein [Photobacterium damselae]MDC4168121.1 hypothetical protein [Photobacterium damselae]
MARLFQAIRELSGNEANISIPRVYIRFCSGDLNQAAVLSQLVFWSGCASSKNDGWFYKRHEQLAEELCLSVDQIRYTLKKLKTRLGESLGTTRKKAEGVPTVFYRFDEEKLMDLIFPEDNFDSVNLPNGNGEITESIRGSHRNLGFGNLPESIYRLNTDPIKQINNPIVPCEEHQLDILNDQNLEPVEPPTKKTRSKRKPKTTLPEDFCLTEAMQAWYSVQGFSLNIQAATNQWMDAMLARGQCYQDWTAAWRSGMRNANQWATERMVKQSSAVNKMGASNGDYGPPEDYR